MSKKDEKIKVVAFPELTNNKPKPIEKTEEEKADEADSNARLAEAMKLQAEMQEAKLQALKVANKSRQTAAVQVRTKNFVRKGKFVLFCNYLFFENLNFDFNLLKFFDIKGQ